MGHGCVSPCTPYDLLLWPNNSHVGLVFPREQWSGSSGTSFNITKRSLTEQYHYSITLMELPAYLPPRPPLLLKTSNNSTVTARAGRRAHRRGETTKQKSATDADWPRRTIGGFGNALNFGARRARAAEITRDVSRI